MTEIVTARGITSHDLQQSDTEISLGSCRQFNAFSMDLPRKSEFVAGKRNFVPKVDNLTGR